MWDLGIWKNLWCYSLNWSKNLLVTDDAYKLKEPIIIDEIEAEIEIEVLNSLNFKNEVPIIPDTHTMMTSQLLDNPNN